MFSEITLFFQSNLKLGDKNCKQFNTILPWPYICVEIKKRMSLYSGTLLVQLSDKCNTFLKMFPMNIYWENIFRLTFIPGKEGNKVVFWDPLLLSPITINPWRRVMCKPDVAFSFSILIIEEHYCGHLSCSYLSAVLHVRKSWNNRTLWNNKYLLNDFKWSPNAYTF